MSSQRKYWNHNTLQTLGKIRSFRFSNRKQQDCRCRGRISDNTAIHIGCILRYCLEWRPSKTHCTRAIFDSWKYTNHDDKFDNEEKKGKGWIEGWSYVNEINCDKTSRNSCYISNVNRDNWFRHWKYSEREMILIYRGSAEIGVSKGRRAEKRLEWRRSQKREGVRREMKLCRICSYWATVPNCSYRPRLFFSSNIRSSILLCHRHCQHVLQLCLVVSSILSN